MKHISKIIIISIISVILLLSVASCSPSISQEEYDKVNNELNNVKLQVAALQDELDEALISGMEYERLNTQYQELLEEYNAQSVEIQAIKSDLNDLNASYEAKIDELQGMQEDYDLLNQEYDELQEQYDAVVQEEVFSVEEVDQAIFALINQERSSRGLYELDWGENIYMWAKWNSIDMSETGDFEYSGWLSVQAVLITAGQTTFDGLVDGVMMVWKQRKHEFSPKILSTSVKYGAVATVKSGDVYYITYVASTDP
jgi:archaellum component FlaC